ncbi:MAG TPA: CinA family protein [Puia sp.]
MQQDLTNIFPIDDIEAIRTALLAHKQTLAVAESVTSGLLQAAFSQATDARQFFQGGITTYNIGQKCRQLRVEPVHALEFNAVSSQVAKEMAMHCSELFCSHYAVGITGYAAPVPEKGIDTPFAYFAIYGNDALLTSDKLDGWKAPALEIQLHYVRQVIETFRKILT